jgi:hypothetical protein
LGFGAEEGSFDVEAEEPAPAVPALAPVAFFFCLFFSSFSLAAPPERGQGPCIVTGGAVI